MSKLYRMRKMYSPKDRLRIQKTKQKTYNVSTDVFSSGKQTDKQKQNWYNKITLVLVSYISPPPPPPPPYVICWNAVVLLFFYHLLASTFSSFFIACSSHLQSFNLFLIVHFFNARYKWIFHDWASLSKGDHFKTVSFTSTTSSMLSSSTRQSGLVHSSLMLL